jgi:hypothetical protein
MKHGLFSVVLLMAATLAPLAGADEDQAGPTQDLTPVSLSYRKVSAGEFGGGQVLQVVVKVKNVGSLAVRGSRGGLRIGAISNPSAALYGPNGLGGFNLGAAIAPGQLGQFLIYAPLGSLSRCQAVRVSIDTAHSLQSGTTLVYYNDSKVLTAVDTQSIRPCVGGIKP